LHAALEKIFAGAKEGLTDTKGEFGTLLSLSPLSVKLDLDPTPLRPDELVVLRSADLKPEDVGKKVALIRCTNGEYLILGEVT
jgi:hypothetical protein